MFSEVVTPEYTRAFLSNTVIDCVSCGKKFDSGGSMALTKEDVRRRTQELPSISLAAIELINIIDYPEVTRADVVKLLTIDEVLFASAFRYANSAAIASMRKIKTLAEVIDILGLNTIKQIAMYTAAKTIYCNEEVWFHSVFLAVAARKIARKLNKCQKYCDEIYMAALFQSYGLLVFRYAYPKEYASVVAIEADYMKQLSKEKELFGVNHLELSAEILYEWGLPDRVITIIANQEDYLCQEFIEQNVIIDLVRFLYDKEFVGDEELKRAFEPKPTLRFLLKKYSIDAITINHELVKKLFEEARAQASIG